MIDTLFSGDKKAALDQLLQLYKQKRFAIVSFLYFANAMKRQLFEDPGGDENYLKKRQKYLSALQDSDFLLADGIALQVFSKFATSMQVENLNGTDFIPYFLQEISKDYSVSVYLYQCYDPTKGKKSDSLQAWVDALKEQFWVSIPWSDQCLYQERGQNFSFDVLQQASDDDKSEVKVFLNCTWTPFQEVRTNEHRLFFEKHEMIVFNAGGLIDFISWFETRAPDRVVKARVLETFRRIATKPKKNLHKFLAMFGIVRFLRKPLKNTASSWKSL